MSLNLLQLDLLDDVSRSDSEDAGLKVRVSARARRLAIRVYPDARVEVVAPPRVRPREIEQFVAAHREWIDAKRAQALRNRPEPQRFPPERVELRASGETLRLQMAGGEGRPRIAELGASTERVLQISGAVSRLRPALREWLMRAARVRLEPRVVSLGAATGTRFERVAIRRQRSRWGSCSVRGTISLNCCLLFQRPEVVDYLVIHELMHVAHMNHSARFWQAVERHCPDWRALDRELVQGWRHVPRWVFSEEG